MSYEGRPTIRVNIKLKPCPFCGSKAEIIMVPGYYGETSAWIVACTAK